jgi:hypothetical protein
MTLNGFALVLCVLALAAPSPAQVTPSPSSKILIGDGVISRGSQAQYTGASEAPFTNAMNALASSGLNSGTIEVLPGTYTFSNTVNVTLAGVRISGGPNARIAPRASLSAACFTVAASASDFVLDGVGFVDERDSPPAVVFVDVHAPRFTMTNCRIAVSNAVAPAAFSHAIRIQGQPDDENFGALIESNVFVVGRPGEGGAIAAPGRTLLRSVHGRNLRVVANTVQSAVVPTVMLLGNAISLQDDEWSSISSNTFSYVKAPLGGAPEVNALVVTNSVEAESNHLVVCANYFERCGGECLVAVKGHGFASLTGNGFGRLEAGASGALYLQGGTGNTVSANNFHNVGTQTTPSIRALSGSGMVLSSNSFSLPVGVQVALDSVDGVVVASNQFLGNTGAAPHLALTNVSGATVTGNRFTCVGAAAIALTATSPMQAFISANVLNPAPCGPGLWTTSNYTVLTSGNPNF